MAVLDTDAYEDLLEEIEEAPLETEEDIESFHIQFLSKKQGRVSALFGRFSDIPPEDRAEFGQRVNALKQRADKRLETAREQLSRKRRADEQAALDLTLPGRRSFTGSIHPITQTLEEIKRIFSNFGFSIAEGPEIEDDWHNFTALNFPPDHPARDMQDTFFLRAGEEDLEDVVLRTHTSPVQIRAMENQQPPLRLIAPGRVYRNEAISYKSFCLFHQVEGLYVDEGVSFADLKQILHLVAQALFGDDVQMRFRPSYFPFTEPSAEVDIWWSDEKESGGGRWLEILGCGMVHPNVFRSVDVDPEKYTGYAFGMGVERIAMLRYGIDDIRLFFENDKRFLEQF